MVQGSKETRNEGAIFEMGLRSPKPLSELTIQAQLRQQYSQQIKRRSPTKTPDINYCISCSILKRESFHQAVSETPQLDST
jgi:hypothetical protein